MYIYMYMSTYIYIYIYVCMHVYVCIYIYIWKNGDNSSACICEGLLEALNAVGVREEEKGAASPVALWRQRNDKTPTAWMGEERHTCVFFFLFLLHSSPVLWEEWGVHVWEFMFIFYLRWLTLRVPTQTCVQFCVLLCACLSRKGVTLILLLFFYPLLNPLCFPFTFPLYERKCAAFEKEKKKKRERKGAFLWKARVAVLISLLLGLFFFPPFFVAGLSEYGEERVPLGLTEGGGETNKKK